MNEIGFIGYKCLYVVVDSTEVDSYFMQGYIPYGNPMMGSIGSRYSKEWKFFQAMVKYEELKG